ncbi:unnamed protein product [marine sediment metagenome]|uniref:Uncharacterized protein n=1 Tax=marine sediment metagenome TaxID=412755 RepID=X1AVV6_9ZZZZ
MTTVVDDVEAKINEIVVKISFVKTLAGKANDPLWLAGDAGYAQFKVIADVQTVLLEVLAGELKVLTT